jgi:SpoVK/Ycf46/Vps4 family AAA+-type ATPase
MTTATGSDPSASTETMNTLLDRQGIVDKMTDILQRFDTECRNVTFKKGMYIYGSPGCGKTQFVTDLLSKLGYDAIVYNSSDVRNKQVIDHIASHHISNRNVLDMMYQRHKPIAIVMDEIDGMNNGDKVGITALMKLIRQKKTKKQRLEHQTLNPIICIGNYYVDKKIKELMKVCHCFELKSPTDVQMERLLSRSVPALTDTPILRSQIVAYVQGDMRKLAFIERVYRARPDFLMDRDVLSNIFQIKSYSDNAKFLAQSLLRAPVPMAQHPTFMNETDRTIVSLLYHENVVDHLWHTLPPIHAHFLYGRMLDNICYADYVDRLTFQHQIWIFNEMSSLIKTFYNQWMVHHTYPEQQLTYRPPEGGVRFTKVLTKYSTEYNNQTFLYQMCQKLDMDRKDMMAFFQEIRLVIADDLRTSFVGSPASLPKSTGLRPIDFASRAGKESIDDDAADADDASLPSLPSLPLRQAQERMLYAQLEPMMEDWHIGKLDIKRMYKFLDKNVKKEAEIHRDMDRTDDTGEDDDDDDGDMDDAFAVGTEDMDDYVVD